MQKFMRGIAAVLLAVLIIVISLTALKWFVKVIFFVGAVGLAALLYMYLRNTGNGGGQAGPGAGTGSSSGI